MTKHSVSTSQDDVLRLLDTRIACLMVDRRDTSKLRPALFQLREKLLQDNLDSKTLARIERTVREMLPPGTARASATLARDDSRPQARVRLVRRAG